jgi:hypothetical protein
MQSRDILQAEVGSTLFQAGECIISGREECITSGRLVLYFKPGNVSFKAGMSALSLAG